MGKSSKLESLVTAFPTFDVGVFFEAMLRDREVAIQMVGRQVSDEGLPSPKAESYIDTGEWDSGKVALCYVASGACLGSIGEDGGDLSDRRFCGVRGCAIKAHKGARWSAFRPGWYIQSERSKRGFYKTSSLVMASEGGPIMPAVAAVLGDNMDPFKLTVGQWKFVMGEYFAVKLSLSSPESDISYNKVVEDVVNAGRDDSTKDEGLEDLVASLESRADEALASGKIPAYAAMSVKPPPDVKTQSTSNVGSLGSSAGAGVDPVVLKSILEKLEGRIENLQLRLAQSESDALLMGRRAMAAETKLTTLMGQVSRMANVTSRVSSLDTELSDIRNSLVDPAGPLNALSDRVTRLDKAVQVGTGVSLHGISLSHPADASGLLLSIGGNVGIFHDVTSLLHSIASSSTSHKTTLTEMKAQRDVKLASDVQARVITSFRTNLPAILYGGSSSVDAIEDYVTLVSKLKSYSMWHSDDGMSGVSQRILNGINEVSKRVQFLANRITTDPNLLRLSSGTVYDSKHFVQQFILPRGYVP